MVQNKTVNEQDASYKKGFEFDYSKSFPFHTFLSLSRFLELFHFSIFCVTAVVSYVFL